MTVTSSPVLDYLFPDSPIIYKRKVKENEKRIIFYGMAKRYVELSSQSADEKYAYD